MSTTLNSSSGVLRADVAEPGLAPRTRPDAGGVGQLSHAARQFTGWLSLKLTFWTVVPIIGLVGMIYLYAYTDSLFQSSAVIDLQNSSSTNSSLSSISSSLFGTSGSSTQSGAVVSYIESPDLLRILDKQFHLRHLYSSPAHSPFWRLDPGASNEDFLSFYQQMVTVTQDPSTQLITINVLDYDSARARRICNAIIAAAQKFVNSMSAVMSSATLKYARDQLAIATKAVEVAQPYERSVAEMELTAAQQGLVSAQALANQQQSFLITVNSANTPSDTSDPDRLVDEAMILLASSLFYMIGHLLLANVRDHGRR